MAGGLVTSAPSAPEKKTPLTTLLPDGSELKGVQLPRYDKNQHLVGLLKAKAVALVSAEKFAGKIISMEFYNPDHSPSGRIDLQQALFDQNQGILTTTEPVKFHSERMNVTGSGLYYSREQNKGFLSGPTTTTLFKLPPRRP